MTAINHFNLYFDGGINDKARSKTCSGYGSWEIEFYGFKARRERLQFAYEEYGRVTSNVAEYLSLCKALIWLDSVKDKGHYRIVIHGDSQLVLKQLTGEYRCKHEGLARWLALAKGRLQHFEWKTRWQPRCYNQQRFGH